MQVGKELPAQVLVHIHFNMHGVPAEQGHRHRLHQNHHEVHKRIASQSGEGPRLDEMPNGVPLEQRQGHVDDGAQQVKQEHSGKGPLVVCQHRKQPLPDFQIKGFGIFLLVNGCHYTSPPCSMSFRSSLLI